MFPNTHANFLNLSHNDHHHQIYWSLQSSGPGVICFNSHLFPETIHLHLFPSNANFQSKATEHPRKQNQWIIYSKIWLVQNSRDKIFFLIMKNPYNSKFCKKICEQFVGKISIAPMCIICNHPSCITVTNYLSHGAV
jgi:hypothetical protein